MNDFTTIPLKTPEINNPKLLESILSDIFPVVLSHVIINYVCPPVCVERKYVDNFPTPHYSDYISVIMDNSKTYTTDEKKIISKYGTGRSCFTVYKNHVYISQSDGILVVDVQCPTNTRTIFDGIYNSRIFVIIDDKIFMRGHAQNTIYVAYLSEQYINSKNYIDPIKCLGEPYSICSSNDKLHIVDMDNRFCTYSTEGTFLSGFEFRYQNIQSFCVNDNDIYFMNTEKKLFVCDFFGKVNEVINIAVKEDLCSHTLNIYDDKLYIKSYELRDTIICVDVYDLIKKDITKMF